MLAPPFPPLRGLPESRLLHRHSPPPSASTVPLQDPGLQIKNIPAILVKIAEGDPRYVALFACVHKRNVGDLDGNAHPLPRHPQTLT